MINLCKSLNSTVFWFHNYDSLGTSTGKINTEFQIKINQRFQVWTALKWNEANPSSHESQRKFRALNPLEIVPKASRALSRDTRSAHRRELFNPWTNHRSRETNEMHTQSSPLYPSMLVRKPSSVITSPL